jgi:hypothetical protein
MRCRHALIATALCLTGLPAMAADIDTDWHFLGGSNALHASGTMPLSRFFALGVTGWFPLATASAARPHMIDGRAYFTLPVGGLMGQAMTIAPWAGYRGAFASNGTASHGPGFGLLIDVATQDFPLGFDLQAGAYPFMQAGGPNWFEFAGTARYTIVDGIKLMGGFRGYVPTSGGALMGPFVGATFGER